MTCGRRQGGGPERRRRRRRRPEGQGDRPHEQAVSSPTGSLRAGGSGHVRVEGAAPQGAGASDDAAQRPLQHRPPGATEPPHPPRPYGNTTRATRCHFQSARCRVKSKETGKSVLTINFGRKHPRCSLLFPRVTNINTDECIFTLAFPARTLRNRVPLRHVSSQPGRATFQVLPGLLPGSGLPRWTAQSWVFNNQHPQVGADPQVGVCCLPCTLPPLKKKIEERKGETKWEKIISG